jgi:hypothetical protein
MHTATAIISTSSWPGATSARRCPASGTSPRRPEPPPGRRPESGTPCPRCCRRPRAGRRRDAELTGLLDLVGNGWPKGMRVIARRERPHPGAQLRITDVDGHRVRHEHPHRRARHPAARPRAAPPPPRRCEDRIRCAKDTGLASLPLHDFAQNQIWCAVWPWPARSPPGCRRSPCTATPPASGSPNGSAFGSSPPPATSPPADEPQPCTWAATHAGPPSHSRHSRRRAVPSQRPGRQHHRGGLDHRRRPGPDLAGSGAWLGHIQRDGFGADHVE